MDGDPPTRGSTAATNDSFELDAGTVANTPVFTTYRNENDFFRGVVSTFDENDRTGTKQFNSTDTTSTATLHGASGTGGLDIFTMEASAARLPAGSQTITAEVNSEGGELVILHTLALMANTSTADTRVQKRLANASKTTYRAGEEVQFLLTVDNRLGSYEALNVVTTDTLPAGVTFARAEISYDGGATWQTPSGQNTAGQTVTTTTAAGTGGTTVVILPPVRRIDPDGSVWGGTSDIATRLGTQDVLYRVTATVTEAAVGSRTNRADVTTGSSDTNTANNTSSVPFTVSLPPTQLTIGKSDGNQAFAPGQVGTYTVTVTNRAGASATTGAIRVSDLLPAGMSYADVTTSTAGTFGSKPAAGAQGRVDWTFTPAAPLAGGQSISFAVRVNVAGTLATGTTLTNYVSVGGGGDPDAQPAPGAACTAEQCASDDTSIQLLADLAVTKTNGASSVNSAGNTTYTVRVTNNGPSTVTGAVLRDPAVTGLVAFETVCSAAAGNRCTVAPTVAQLQGATGVTLPTLAAGEFYEFTLTANVTATGGSVSNTASVTLPATVQDPNAANNSAADTDTVTVPSGPAVPPGIWSGAASSCLDFSGVSLSVNGAPITRSLLTAEGVTVTYTLDATSNAQYATGGSSTNYNVENVLNGYTPGTWNGDRWDDYFGAGKVNALYNNPVGRRVGYTLSAYATYNGQAVPLTMLTGSAEDDGANEYVRVTTNGSAFAVADRTVGSSRYGDVTVTDTGRTVQMSVNSATGNFLLVATTKADASASSPLILTNELAGNGATAQGFCVAFPFDRGDNPATYGRASHLQNLTFTSPLSSNVSAGLNTTTFAVSPATSRTTTYLGGQPNSEVTERGTDASSDSDDALSTTLNLPVGATTYSVNVPYTTNVPATVAGWIDFSGNGLFEPGERTSVNVPAGTGTATLTWNGINVSATGAGTYSRFRVSSNTSEATSPTGGSVAGEVEDHPVSLIRQPALSVAKSVSSDFIRVTPDTANAGTAALPATQLSPSQLQYTITVTNTGTSAASDVRVTDILPSGLTFVSATLARSTAAATYPASAPIANSGTAQDLAFNVGSLTATEPGRSAQIVVTANVNLAANTYQTALRNTAATSATGVSSTSSNEVKTDIVYPKLTKRVRNITQNVPTGPSGEARYGTAVSGYPNDILEYCLDYRNYSSVPIEGWTLTDSVPANTTFVTGSQTPAAAQFVPEPAGDFQRGEVQFGPVNLAAGATGSGSVCFRVEVD
ncbi:GEVED domain-containing protein [Deinococcus radiophilus]